MDKWYKIKKSVDDLKENNLYRTITVIDSPQSSHITVQNKKMLLFASNDYLDFCNDPEVKIYAINILKKYGTGSGGSRLTTGTMKIHVELEKELAKFKNRESCILFNSGFSTNSNIIPALCKENDVIFSDELNHASIIDGCHQSKAKTIIYKHNNMKDLENKIKNSDYETGLIVSDGVFSMDGDIVNLPKLVDLAKKYNLFSMIDEAHATGVIGKTGKGTEEYYNMRPEIDILMGTLSKSFGSEGGYVCGSKLLIDYLRNHTRSFIFSTALSPVTIASALKSLQLLKENPNRVLKLQENIEYFCNCLKDQDIQSNSKTAIIPIYIGNEKKAILISKYLMNNGYYISAIRYPTVKRNKAMLRVTLMSSHTKKELKSLAKIIKESINIY